MSHPAPLTVGQDGGLPGTPGRSALTLLDPLETKAQPLDDVRLPEAEDVHPDCQWTPITLQEAEIRHTGWRANRRRVWDSLIRTRQAPNRRHRFANCGSASWVQYSPSRDRHRISCNTCKDRWCVPCQRQRAAVVRHQLGKLRGHLRLITLTLRHGTTTLKQQIDRLYASFRELRRLKLWKEACPSGIAILEVKLSKAGRWHPHLHCVVSGSWIAQRDLSQAWLGVTGDSSIVDVRAVKGPAELGSYVTKYLTKAVDQSVYHNPDKLDEAVVTLKGRRQILPWGQAREWIKEDAEDQDDLPNDWIALCPLDRLIEDAQAGHGWAAALLTQLTQGPAPPRKDQ